MLFSTDRCWLLDGACGSNMIAAGMPQGVCVEQWILEHPDVFRRLAKGFVDAGAQAVYAPTFGANRVKLAQYGLENQVASINRSLVTLTREAVGSGTLVGGDMTGTGLFVEPFGETDFQDLVAVYVEQASALKEAGVDFLVGETLMNLADARACMIAAQRVGLPAVLTITVDENGRTLSGMEFLAGLVTLQAMGAVAVGLNCSTGPEGMVDQIAKAAKYAAVPLAAKPNAGRPGEERDPETFARAMEPLVQAGARVVGGCCGTTPAHLAALHTHLSGLPLAALPEREDVIVAASATHPLFLQEKTIELSEPIACSYDMADELIQAEEEDGNVALVAVNSVEEAKELSLQVHMSPMPIAVRAADAQSLEQALFYLQGRALVDTKSDVEPEEAARIAKRYGAILY